MFAVAMLVVLLFAVLVMGTSANADGAENADAAVLSDEYGRSADSGALALWNTEYHGAPYFRLCLHGYQDLDPDATVTVTAYIPGTLTPFYRATFTKDYLVLKDTFNLVGGVLTQGAVLRLPAVCQLKIEVNGDNVDGWDLVYGTYVEEAAIWSPNNMNPLTWFWEVFGSDYVYGNATCMWATDFGGHVVHLGIDVSADGSDPDDPSDPGGNDPDGDNPGGNDPGGDNPGGDNPGGDNPGGDNPGGDNPGGDNPGGNDPGGDNPGGDNPGGDNPGGDNPGGDNPGGDNPGGNDPGGDNPGGDNPGGDNPGGNDPGGNDPGGDNPNGDNPDTPDKPSEPKEPAETGDTRSIVLMIAIALVSTATLAVTYRKRDNN